jgi:hypothetical protein
MAAAERGRDGARQSFSDGDLCATRYAHRYHALNIKDVRGEYMSRVSPTDIILRLVLQCIGPIQTLRPRSGNGI